MPRNKPPRKKKQARASKLAQVKKVKIQKADAQNAIMNELSASDAQCDGLLKMTLAFTPFLKNQELVDAGDTEAIIDNATILSNDTILLKEELIGIRNDTPAKINPDDPDELMMGLQIGSRYRDWIEKYGRTIAVHAETLTKLFDDANKALTPIEGELM